MAIKTTNTKSPNIQTKSKYPYIAYHPEYWFSVLLTNQKSGFIIETNDNLYPLGYSSDGWNEECLVPLPKGEQIILENN